MSGFKEKSKSKTKLFFMQTSDFFSSFTDEQLKVLADIVDRFSMELSIDGPALTPTLVALLRVCNSPSLVDLVSTASKCTKLL